MTKYCLYCMRKHGEDHLACEYCMDASAYDAPIHHIEPGTILKEKYMIGRALGEGGFGITYIGRDLTLDMRIAIKEFYPSGYAQRNHQYANSVMLTKNNCDLEFEKDMQRFLNEARILAKFSSEPGVVSVRDFFRENGTAYIVMEYLDGITLRTYLKDYGTILADDLFKMLDPVMKCLGLIHEQGLIHRDISPDNIMVMKNGQLKLLDFGAAREVNADKSLSVVLKHGYAPEEQYRTKGNQGPWTDVYAMCATLYKCLTGITPMESLERAYSDGLKPPSQLGVCLSRSQEAALMKGLSIRIGDRLQTMAALREGLLMNNESEVIHSVTVHNLVEQDECVTVYESVAGDSVELTHKIADQAVPEDSGSQVVPILSVTDDALNDISDDLGLQMPWKTGVKPSKTIMSAAAAVVALMLIVVITLFTPSKNPKPNLQSEMPKQRVMASDCMAVLQWSDIDCGVLDIEVNDEDLNEKYKTLIVTCDVTVLEDSKEKMYAIELYYDYDNGNWVLSGLSKITK